MFGNRICEKATAAFVMILIGFWNIITTVVRMLYLSNTSFGNGMNIAAIVCFGFIILVKIVELALCEKKYE
jgi:membrane protein CcdC involved in cytochrome C biogenesis